MHSTTAPHALILGGYGLIGAAAMRALDQAGFQVTGLGRTQQTAQQVMPNALWPNMRWQFADLTRLSITDWQKILTDVDVVVNAAGALQDGGGTDLTAIHEEMPHRLIAALKGRTTRVVQISAAGVRPDASTEFFRSKARGDALLTASNLNYVILRPTLVLGEAAYGGTALLRAAAAMPLIDWRVMQGTQIQTVALDDLCQAIVSCARGDIAPGTIADLTETKSRSFPEVIRLMRCWLGLPPPRLSLPLPPKFLQMTAKGADLLSTLGWTSPLRSTAIQALSDGIGGDPVPWVTAGGSPCRSLEKTLKAHPASVQERWFARLYLLLPVVIATLSIFWLLSGLIGMLQFSAAVEVLTNRGLPHTPAQLAVGLGSVLDMVLGIIVLFRPLLRTACLGMIGLTAGYLIAGTFMTPDLWLDPLGAFVKTLPAAILALLPLALAQNR